jgi:hypothetical protein
MADSSTLDPLVERVAKIYGFTIKFDDDLNKWIIESVENRWESYSFYWSSECSVVEFFEELERYFNEKGYASANSC